MIWRRRFLSIDRILTVQCLAFASLLAIWELLASSGWFYKSAIPHTLYVLEALVQLVTHPAFWFNFSVSTMEIFLSMAIGGAAAIAAGIILGSNDFIGRALEPYVNALASTPKVILFPVFLVAFGIGPEAKVAIGAVACFFPVLLSVIAGTRQINGVYLSVGKSFNLSTLQMARMIYLPALIEPILTGLRIALGVAIIVCLLAEIKISNKGLGYMVAESYKRSRFSEMYAMLIIIFVIAIAGNAIIERLARRQQA